MIQVPTMDLEIFMEILLASSQITIPQLTHRTLIINKKLMGGLMHRKVLERPILQAVRRHQLPM